jgi:hypothetical protein
MYLLGGGVFFALFAGNASPAYHVSIEKPIIPLQQEP